MSSIPDASVATAPNASDDLFHLVQEIDSQSNAYSDGRADARLRLVAAAQSLLQAMETPQETMLRYIWAQVIDPSVLRLHELQDAKGLSSPLPSPLLRRASN